MTDKTTISELLENPTASLASSKAEIERLLKLKAELEIKAAEINDGLAVAEGERKKKAVEAIVEIIKAADLTPGDVAPLFGMSPKPRKTPQKASKAKPKTKAPTAKKKPAKAAKTAGKTYSQKSAPSRPAKFFNPKTILDPAEPVRQRLWSGLGSRQPIWAKGKKPIEDLDAFLKAKEADAATIKEVRKAAGL
jgi:hypothetical protein